MKPVVHLASRIINNMDPSATFQTYCFIMSWRSDVFTTQDPPTCLACIAYHQTHFKSLLYDAVRLVRL